MFIIKVILYIYVNIVVISLSSVQLGSVTSSHYKIFATSWTAAFQASINHTYYSKIQNCIYIYYMYQMSRLSIW